MSRNVINTMNKIFDVMIKSVNEEDIYRISKIKRHITADCDEVPVIDFVKYSKIKVTAYNQMMLILFEYRQEKYLLTSNKYEADIQRIGFDIENELALIQGAGMIVISEDCLKIRNGISSLDIINDCLGIEEDGKTGINFQFSDILKFFEEYCLIKIDENRFELQYEEDFNRLYGLMINNESNLILSSAVEKLKLTLLLLSSRSVATSVINCLESRSIEYAFLQLYQCLEYLYIINNSISISTSHKITQEIAIDIVLQYKLKSTEEENLYKVLKDNTPEEALELFFNGIVIDPNGDKYKTVAAYIYKIRCNIAHLRYNQENILSIVQWEKLIDSICEIIYSTYQRMDKQIINICINKNTLTDLDLIIKRC